MTYDGCCLARLAKLIYFRDSKHLPPQSDGHDAAPIDVIPVWGYYTRHVVSHNASQLDNHNAVGNPPSTTRSDATASYGELLGAAPTYEVCIILRLLCAMASTGHHVAPRAGDGANPCASARCRRCQHATCYAGNSRPQRLPRPHAAAHQGRQPPWSLHTDTHGSGVCVRPGEEN